MATKSKLLQAAAGAAAAGGAGGADDNINQVTMLVHADGTDGDANNVFLDESRNNFTIGAAGPVTNTSFSPYGTRWSLNTNSTSQYLNAPAGAGDFGSGDFTVEFWLITTSTNQPGVVTQSNSTGGTGTSWGVFLGYAAVSGGVAWYMSDGTNYFSTISTGTSVVNDGKWHHIAACRSGSTFYLWVDGVSQGTSTSSTALGNGTHTIRIGGQGGISSYTLENGYISDVRIVKGTALYTSSFTPPTEPLTAISGTSLLTCNANRFKDGSSNNYTITPVGEPLVSSVSPYAPTDSYIPEVPDVNGFAFDGNGDGVYVDGHADLAFGTGDFTVECWLYINEHKDYIEVYDARGTGDTNNHVTIYTDSSAKIYFYVNTGNRITSSAGDLRAREWNHIALVRDSNASRIYINGVQSGNTYVDFNSYLEPTTPSIGYSKVNTNFYMDGYISNFRAVKGTALYTSTFTPPTAPLENISGTALLTCQDDFKDNSSNNLTFTRVGDPKLTEADPFSDYWGVGFREANYNRLNLASSTALQIGSSDFTLELFFKSSGDDDQYDVIAIKGYNVNNTREYGFEFNGAGGIYWLYSTNGTGWTLPVVVSSGSVKPNVWHHLVAQRNGSQFDVWFDGTRTYTDSSHPNYHTAASDFMIGGYDDGSTADYWSDISISNLRLVKGSAVYTSGSSITVPTENLTAIPNTSLLTCQSNRFVDNSSNNATITVYYKPEILQTNPFNDQLPERIGSGYFDGSADYLETPNDAEFVFSGDYTIEGWMYPRSRTGTILDFGGSGSREQLSIDTGTLYWGYPVTFGTSNFLEEADLHQWHHIAVSRLGQNNYIWLDGNRVNTYTDSTTYGPSASPQVRIGQRSDGSYNTKGYLTGIRMTKACIYNGADYAYFDPPTKPLQPVAGTNLLMNFDNGNIIDSVNGNALIAKGTTKISNSSPKFGTGFMYFPDNNAHILIPKETYDLNLDGDFTLEMFYKTQSATSTNNIAELFCIGDTEDSGGVVFYIYQNSLRMYGGSATIYNHAAGSYMESVGQWNHIAFVRSGSTITGYMNGTSVGTATDSTAYTNKQYDYVIGKYRYGVATLTTNRGASIDLSIDDFRITKGVARYTSNFTPPTSAFPNK